MNLHITNDNIFIDNIIRIAGEIGETTDKFLIYTGATSDAVKRVKSPGILHAGLNSPEFKAIVGDPKAYTNIFIHWLEGPIVDFVLSLPKDVPLTWCFWGGDGEVAALNAWLYQPTTLRYFKKLKPRLRFTSIWPQRMRQDLRGYLHQLSKPKKHLEAMARVDYFAHYIPQDYEMLKKYAGLKAAYIPFHYACVEDIVPEAPYQENHSRNILLGNSDTLPNNHFECIDILAGMELKDRTVICPLSYEGKTYAKDVSDYGRKKLGKAFMPLMEYMPKDDYNKLLASVGFAFMNHNRSQAFGNIMSLLYSGVSLFMSKHSTLYQLLTEQGFVINEIRPGMKEDALVAIGKNEVMKNRELLKLHYGSLAQREKIRKMLTRA